MASIPLHVTEWMKGYIGFGAKDHDAGFIAGLESETFFLHEMDIKIDDIDRFVAEPKHTATMDGFIECAALGGKRPCTGATFNMLVDSATPALKYMLYRMPFSDGRGEPRTLIGHKTVHDDRSLDLWSDTTTLYVSIFEGLIKGSEEPSVPPLAMGVIHIEKLDLIRSLRSFRSPGSTPAQASHAMSTFGRFFMGKLWEIYGGFGRIG
jgi:cholesterol oxidase